MTNTASGLKKLIGAAALLGMSSAAFALPTLNFNGQSFSATVLSNETDFFVLSGLSQIPTSDYTATISANGASSFFGNFSVFSADSFSINSGISGSINALGGNAFSSGTPSASFSFDTQPGKFLFATVTGASGNASYDLHFTPTIAPPIPEAETWAMMLLGLGMLSTFAYRRKIANPADRNNVATYHINC